jgi:hypothetical protein
MQCNAMQCNVMQCNAMQCNAMQCNAMQFNATPVLDQVPSAPPAVPLRGSTPPPTQIIRAQGGGRKQTVPLRVAILPSVNGAVGRQSLWDAIRVGVPLGAAVPVPPSSYLAWGWGREIQTPISPLPSLHAYPQPCATPSCRKQKLLTPNQENSSHARRSTIQIHPISHHLDPHLARQ